MEKEKFNAILMLVGGTIGAGFLGIPYAISRAGFMIGFFEIIGIGILSIIMSLYVAEIILRTRDKYQVVGLAETYLGKKGKALMTLGILVGMYGALTAYAIGVGQTIHTMIGGNAFLYSGIFLIVASFLVFKGLKVIKDCEAILVSLIIPFLLIICFSLIPNIDLNNLTTVNWQNIAMPYGVILFACLSYSAVPEIAMAIKNKGDLKGVILGGGAIYIVLYVLFALSLLGTYGANIAEIATGSLAPQWISILGNLTAFLTMGTTFLILGLVLRDTYMEDFHLNKYTSWALACLIPFAIVFLLKPGFIDVLSIVGTFTGGLVGILLGIIVIKSRKQGYRLPEFTVPGGIATVIATTFFFCLGIVIELMFYFNMF